MSMQQFIQKQIFAPRLSKAQVLVVYDPEKQLRDTCLTMNEERRVVVDASDSSISSRGDALGAFQRLGAGSIDELLVYIPTAKPVEDDEKQRDPFSIYSSCGAVFPSGDGDTLLSICLKAKPDHTIEIRRVFEGDRKPSFAVLDAIGGGSGWPTLQALLAAESARDIIFALLTPNSSQEQALKSGDTWVAEAKSLLQTALGLNLKTRGKTWSSISDELWRFVLFSEFVFDLPGGLPQELADIPSANTAARQVIEDICDRLRNDRRTRDIYIDHANDLQRILDLPRICADLEDLGERDTFPFEERTFLANAISAFEASDTERVQRVLERHAESVWTGIGESQAQWDFVRAALELAKCIEDVGPRLSEFSRSMDALIDFYVSQLREVDRLHREFEQAVSANEWQDSDSLMKPIQAKVRSAYSKLIGQAQAIFTKHLQTSGWPASGRLANIDLFDKLVAPKLKEGGTRIAYLMIDALRYELGLSLEELLVDDGKVQLQPAMAQLPTVTPVGMSSLLPGAATQLKLVKKDGGGYLPFIGDKPMSNVAQRISVFSKLYGNRFQEGRLEEFVRDKFEVEADTDLLVLRALEIDSQFENHPDTAPNEIINALNRIRRAVRKLKELRFNEVIIVTDHGFFMNTSTGPGDTCAKLNGNWLNDHQRCLLGEGAGDSHHYLLSAEKAGIKGDFPSIAGPLSMASYQSGLLYYHGGASLQECVVPVITVSLSAPEQASVAQTQVALNYKNGAKRITTRLPVIEISLENLDMFSTGSDFEILLEAQDKKGNVVGEAKPGGHVNPATGTITLKPGDSLQVTLKMQLEFEGKFKVKAFNPTTMAVFCQIDLETDYTV